MIARSWIPLAWIVMVFLLDYPANGADVALRVMTFNLEDVRHSEVSHPDNPRLRRLAEVIQRIRPNVVLLNEIETVQSNEQDSTADLFIRNYLVIPQADDLNGLDFTSYSPSTNTGIHSGLDLDQSGFVDDTLPPKTFTQSNEQRAFGADCFGFGGFPGQYGMSLLVDPRIKISTGSIRTFQNFLWQDLPNAIAPTNPDGSLYYTHEAWDVFRLASKTFADVPLILPDGQTIHALISHPTPPAFDGAEMRNKHRNRDEIRLIRSYLDDEQSLYDDSGLSGGLQAHSTFVILGDLNADPVDGSSLNDPINTFLLSSDRVAADVEPKSEIDIKRLDPTDTSLFRLRVDYVLPSSDCTVVEAGVWRYSGDSQEGFASDHFPVWVDLIVHAQD